MNLYNKIKPKMYGGNFGQHQQQPTYGQQHQQNPFQTQAAGYHYGQQSTTAHHHPAGNSQQYTSSGSGNNGTHWDDGNKPWQQRKKAYLMAAQQLATPAPQQPIGNDHPSPSTLALRHQYKMSQQQQQQQPYQQQQQQQQSNYRRSPTAAHYGGGTTRSRSNQPTRYRSQDPRQQQQQQQYPTQYNTTSNYNNDAHYPRKQRYSAKQVWQVQSCSAFLTLIIIFLGLIFAILTVSLHIADAVDDEGGTTTISLWTICVKAGRRGSLCDRQHQNLVYGSMCTTPFLQVANGNSSAITPKSATRKVSANRQEEDTTGDKNEENVDTEVKEKDPKDEEKQPQSSSEKDDGSSSASGSGDDSKNVDDTAASEGGSSSSIGTGSDEATTEEATSTDSGDRPWVKPLETPNPTAEPSSEEPEDSDGDTPDDAQTNSGNKVFVTDYSYSRYYTYNDAAVRAATGQEQCYNVNHWLNAVVPAACNIKDLMYAARGLSITCMILFLIAGVLIVTVHFCGLGRDDGGKTADRTRQIMGMLSCLLVILSSAMLAVFVGMYRNPRRYTCGVRELKPNVVLEPASAGDRMVPEDATVYSARSMHSQGWTVGVGPVCSGLCLAAAICMVYGSFRLKSSTGSAWDQLDLDQLDPTQDNNQRAQRYPVPARKSPPRGGPRRPQPTARPGSPRKAIRGRESPSRQHPPVGNREQNFASTTPPNMSRANSMQKKKQRRNNGNSKRAARRRHEESDTRHQQQQQYYRGRTSARDEEEEEESSSEDEGTSEEQQQQQQRYTHSVARRNMSGRREPEDLEECSSSDAESSSDDDNEDDVNNNRTSRTSYASQKDMNRYRQNDNYNYNHQYDDERGGGEVSSPHVVMAGSRPFVSLSS